MTARPTAAPSSRARAGEERAARRRRRGRRRATRVLWDAANEGVTRPALSHGVQDISRARRARGQERGDETSSTSRAEWGATAESTSESGGLWQERDKTV